MANLNQLPVGMHGWAQSDRYAIALNYLDEDNILRPKTNALYTEDGKVGVEFSGIAYLSAKIALVFDAPEYLPLFFRSLNLLFLALLITFFLAIINDFDIVNALINFLIWFATPLLLFYGYNFIPDSLGLGFAVASLGLYYLFHKKGNTYLLTISLIIGSIGGLIKLPILIYPIAIMAHQLYRQLITKKIDIKKSIPLIIGAVVILSVLFYDYVYLIKANDRLWSVIFMGQPNPILTFEDLSEAFKGILYWRFEFFNPIQLTAIGIVFIFMLIRIKSIALFYKEFGFIILIGLLFYFIGLGKQLIHHDYYFLSSFLPFILFVVSLQSKRLLNTTQIRFKALLFVIGLLVSFNNFKQAKARLAEYYTIRGNTLDNNLLWLKNGSYKLDEAGLSKDEKIFVLYDFAPNTSLVYFNRKGLVFNHEQMSRKEPHIEVWLEKLNPNYIIVKSDWEKDFFKDKPVLAHTWIRIPFDGFILFKRP